MEASRVLKLILEDIKATASLIEEAIELHKRDAISRMDRKIRERAGNKLLARNMFSARRERKARDRYRAMKGVELKPLKRLSTRLRIR